MKVWSRRFAVLVVAASATACGGSEQTATAEPATTAQPAAAEAATATAATGEVIEVRMTMANGGRFEPETVTARPGDVIRFVNVENVHNVSFPAARNAGLSNLPAASPYLTAPGQTWDLVVDLEPGSYTFQCDPHVPMGMFGTLVVE